jgi:hypothetical protein
MKMGKFVLAILLFLSIFQIKKVSDMSPMECRKVCKLSFSYTFQTLPYLFHLEPSRKRKKSDAELLIETLDESKADKLKANFIAKEEYEKVLNRLFALEDIFFQKDKDFNNARDLANLLDKERSQVFKDATMLHKLSHISANRSTSDFRYKL